MLCIAVYDLIISQRSVLHVFYWHEISPQSVGLKLNNRMLLPGWIIIFYSYTVSLHRIKNLNAIEISPFTNGQLSLVWGKYIWITRTAMVFIKKIYCSWQCIDQCVQEEAATKIQAGYRGYVARKEVATMKEEKVRRSRYAPVTCVVWYHLFE